MSHLVATATEETSTSTKTASQIHGLAWIIVLVSFAMFCSLTIAISGGVYYFLFRSTLPMEVLLEVGRGSAGIVTVDDQQFPRSRELARTLSNRPATASTGTLDQATITFDIPSENEGEAPIVIGTLTLQNDSSITLDNARRPRFAWSHGVYVIEFSEFSGEGELFITDIPQRPLLLRIKTLLGNATYIFDTEGRYTISTNNATIRVTTYEGRALLVSPDNRNNRLAVAGEQAILLIGANLPVVTAAPINLIDNGLFAFNISPNLETGQLQMPTQWGCFNRFDAPPSGRWFADRWEGRSAIRLIRETGDKSSQTGCSRLLDIDVSDFTRLELQATIAINHQSLINCGFVGSECPLMIFIVYDDAQGEERSWYQGLFYNYDQQNPAPLICQTCVEAYEHRPIAEQVWYTYESGNLFARLPEEQRPVRILEVRFYASGHQYDVFVSEMALIAGTEQVSVPPDQIPNDN